MKHPFLANCALLALLSLSLVSCAAFGAREPSESPTRVWAEFALDEYRGLAQSSFEDVVFEAATSPLNVVFDDQAGQSWRETQRLFRIAGAISSDELAGLLAQLRSSMAQDLEELGAKPGQVEDQPRLMPLSALQNTLALSFGDGYRWYQFSVQGFRQTYRSGQTKGAVDVLAMQFNNGFEPSTEHWALGVCISEPVLTEE